MKNSKINVLTITDILLTIISYTICVNLLMCVFAGIVAENYLFIVYAVAIVTICFCIILILKKRGMTKRNTKKHTTKSIRYTIIGIVFLCIVFFMDYIWMRPSVTEVNKLQKTVAMMFENENFSDYDYLHMANSHTLQLIAEVVNVIELSQECAEELKAYQGRELTETEQIEVAKFVQDKQDNLSTIQESIQEAEHQIIIHNIIKYFILMMGAILIYKGKQLTALHA